MPISFRYQSQAVSSFGSMSAIPKLSIKDKLSLNQADASYVPSLECQTAIGKYVPSEVVS